MPTPLTDETIIGEVYAEWVVPEYEQHKRPLRWYVVIGGLSLLFLLYALLSANFMFALILILAGIILFMQARQEPPKVPVAITELGVVLGNRFYKYNEFEAFYIIYQPPRVKTLYLETSRMTRPILRIPLKDQNPVDIQQTLRAFLPEDIEKEEPLSDALVRNWGIH